MSRFKESSDRQLREKMVAMRSMEATDAISEWCEREIARLHLELEKVFDHPSTVTLVQGRIAQLRDLLVILKPSAPVNTAA